MFNHFLNILLLFQNKLVRYIMFILISDSSEDLYLYFTC